MKGITTPAGLSDGASCLWRCFLLWEAPWKPGGLKLHKPPSDDDVIGWTAEKNESIRWRKQTGILK